MRCSGCVLIAGREVTVLFPAVNLKGSVGHHHRGVIIERVLRLFMRLIRSLDMSDITACYDEIGRGVRIRAGAAAAPPRAPATMPSCTCDPPLGIQGFGLSDEGVFWGQS